MCGIAAAVGVGAEERVERMVARMAYRGIRSRVESGAGWAVGHVRLPIVGTGEEHDQPIRRGRWTIAFAGEVLDFRERRPGAECDADLVADAWTEEGPGGFVEFDGFWAVLAYDSSRGVLHALSDYLAQKPLYVRVDRLGVAAASEPDAVSCLGPTDLDEVYLSDTVKWGYCPETWRTPYVEVRRLLPGEHLVLGRSGVESARTTDQLRPLPLSADGLRAEIDLAVRRRVLSSDVPVAALVSGGLDSSIVLELARRYADVRAYHAESGEWEYARLVAPGAARLDFSEVSVADGLDWMQEPIDLGSLLPQVALARAISGSGAERVCLTGDGADELFGGYGRSERYDSQASDVWHELVAWHLPRLDRVMSRRLVEVRSPFLARRVAAAALALPRADRTGKRILREIFSRDLPRAILDRPKVPLRTAEVAADRESRSRLMVEMFRERARSLSDA